MGCGDSSGDWNGRSKSVLLLIIFDFDNAWILHYVDSGRCGEGRAQHRTEAQPAQDKLRLPRGADHVVMREVLAQSHDAAARFLQGYPDASYRSYVFLTLIHAMLGPQVISSPEPWNWLGNDRIGINCRVDLAYRIAKDAANGMA